MKIAQIAPLMESVPPKLYGGTERAVSYLTEELVRLGHDVTLFATADSQTEARLVVCAHGGLRLAGATDVPAFNAWQAESVRWRAGEFDVLHFHTDFSHFPMVQANSFPALTTMHGRLDIQAYLDILVRYPDLPFVSISNSQRSPLPNANWVGNIYHGLPRDLYCLDASLKSEPYLAFLGRICDEKGIEPAIEISRRAGIKLKIAAKVDPHDKDYYEHVIKPLLADPGVEFVGEIVDREKQEFLGCALAVLFPIMWPEPFGLVMIEAMACGTPVIAYRKGSVPEVITDGVTGFIVNDVDGAVAAIARLGQLDRRVVRQAFDERFTVEREANAYLKVYEVLVMIASADSFGTIRENMERIRREETVMCPRNTSKKLHDCLREAAPCISDCPHHHDWIGPQK